MLVLLFMCFHAYNARVRDQEAHARVSVIHIVCIFL